MVNIAIIGVGALGKRHLEAVLKCKEEMSIYCVDVNPLALDGFQVNDIYVNKKIFFSTELDELPENIEVAIFAMSSANRREMFDKIVHHSVVRNIVFEKVLFQKVDDYYHVRDELNRLGIKAWVNTARRCVPFWKKMKEELEDTDFLEVHISGGNWGLGCNCAHMMDLISYLSNCNELKIEKNFFFDKVVDSKRIGYKELYGLYSGSAGRCRHFTVACYDNNMPIKIELFTEKCNYEICEAQGICKQIDCDSGIEQHETFEPVYVSQSTQWIVEDILKEGKCDLPQYDESMHIHLEYIKPMIDYFEEKGMEKGICPIT